MAEKEERILITQWNIKDDICPVPADSQCYTTKSCDDCKVGMSRQEAIERMAMSLHKESVRISNMEKDFDKLPAGWRKSFYNYAEAALNALLGE